MTGIRLNGLEGTNPLGFLAALGVQVALACESKRPCLWWSDDVTPRAVVDDRFGINQIVEQSLATFAIWKNSPALNPRRRDGSLMPRGDDLKLAPSDIRTYIDVSRNSPAAALSRALVVEGSLDKKGVAKPSDLYFTGGQQKLLVIARKILEQATAEDVSMGLSGPWSYSSTVPSLMWDVADDRVYALRAYDPTSSGEKKLSNPGVEALAILGMSLHTVFASRDRTLTEGCSGSWTNAFYSWPLWVKPASPLVVKSLLAHAHNVEVDQRYRWFKSWGVSTVLRCAISRSDQGSYGTFRPPTVLWRQDLASRPRRGPTTNL